DGSRLWGDNCCGNTWVETGNLPQAGTYKIFLDPVGALTGTLTITAYDVPPEDRQTTRLNSSHVATSYAVSCSKKKLAFTFPGAVAHRVRLSPAPTSTLFPYTTLFRSDGSRLWGDNCCGNTWVETGNLPQAGTYKIFLDPVGALTGTLTITAYDVPP